MVTANRTALVFGASGRIGSAVCEEFRRAGFRIEAAIRGRHSRPESCDVVVNAAGAGMAASVAIREQELRAANVEVAVLAAEVAIASRARLVHIGTAAGTLDDRSDAYVETKREASEKLADMKLQGLEVVELRPHLVVGGHWVDHGLLERIALDIATHGTFHLHRPHLRRDIVHARDVATAVLLAATTSVVAPSAIEIGTGCSMLMSEVAEAVAHAVGAPGRWTADDTTADGAIVADPRPAVRHLQFEARLSPAAAVQAALDGEFLEHVRTLT